MRRRLTTRARSARTAAETQLDSEHERYDALNIYSQVGLITLVGLVAKNGILIVELAEASA